MSVSGNATGVRFGVATSTNRPATPFDGQVISETDTDRLVVFNGSAWGSYGGLQLIKTQTIGSGVSSVSVTDAFSATYDNYKITISGGVGSTNTDFDFILTGSTTGYYYGVVYNSYNASTTSLGATNAAAWRYTGAITTGGLFFDMDILGPNLAKWTSYHSYLTRSDIQGFNSGNHQVATAYTGFTITAFTGNITGGTIRVYGYLNS